MRLLRDDADAVEADLSRYHQIDYRDRWRVNADGSRRLTLRMIAVRLRFLPRDSATAMAQGSSGWLLEHYLAAHLFHATTGDPHPALPKETPISDPEREKKRQRALARLRERERAIAAGELT